MSWVWEKSFFIFYLLLMLVGDHQQQPLVVCLWLSVICHDHSDLNNCCWPINVTIGDCRQLVAHDRWSSTLFYVLYILSFFLHFPFFLSILFDFSFISPFFIFTHTKIIIIIIIMNSLVLEVSMLKHDINHATCGLLNPFLRTPSTVTHPVLVIDDRLKLFFLPFSLSSSYSSSSLSHSSSFSHTCTNQR